MNEIYYLHCQKVMNELASGIKFKKFVPNYPSRRKWVRYKINIGKLKIEWIKNLKYWKIEFNFWTE